MAVKFKVINKRTSEAPDGFVTSFKYYVDGDCACGAKKVSAWRTTFKPSIEDCRKYAEDLERRPLIRF